MIRVIFFVFILAASVTASLSQTSKAVSQGTVSNKNGVKFTDWDMKLYPGSPLVEKHRITILHVHSYHFTSSKNQQFSVKLQSLDKSVKFGLCDDNGKPVDNDSEEKRSWQGLMTGTGKYKIVVSSEKPAEYTITFITTILK